MGRGCLLLPSCSEDPAQDLRARPGGGNRGQSSGRGTRKFKEAWVPRKVPGLPQQGLSNGSACPMSWENSVTLETLMNHDGRRAPRQLLSPPERAFQASPASQAQGQRCPGDVLQSYNDTPLEGPGLIRASGGRVVQAELLLPKPKR